MNKNVFLFRYIVCSRLLHLASAPILLQMMEKQLAIFHLQIQKYSQNDVKRRNCQFEKL